MGWAAQDGWLAAALAAAPSEARGASVEALRKAGREALAGAALPTPRDEAFRFTDLAPLAAATLVGAGAGEGGAVDAAAEVATGARLAAASSSTVVVVDGAYCAGLSDLTGVPDGVTIAPAAGAPEGVVEAGLGVQSGARGAVLASLNAAATQDAVVISVTAGTKVEAPVHVLYVSTTAAPGDGERSARASYPRLLVSVGEGASLKLVEEFCSTGGEDGGSYFTDAVAELSLGEGARVTHTLACRHAPGALHAKGTFVSQQASSSYELTEVGLGGSISRHDISVKQEGPETHTGMRAFLLAGEGQLHDLHSQLVMDHPKGTSDQLHKCIVSHATGRGVFDGNVQVNRLAQETDAAQLTRNLLLVPKATVNVKPNLQIVADNVKCTHGCTVSDLDDEELFYLQSRGLDPSMARSALVQGFGLEVVQGVEYPELRARLEELVRTTLG